MTGSKHFNPFHTALQYSYRNNFFPLLPFNTLYVTSLLPARSYLYYHRSGEQSTRKNSSTKYSKEAVLSVCVKNRPIYSSGEKSIFLFTFKIQMCKANTHSGKRRTTLYDRLLFHLCLHQVYNQDG